MNQQISVHLSKKYNNSLPVSKEEGAGPGRAQRVAKRHEQNKNTATRTHFEVSFRK